MIAKPGNMARPLQTCFETHSLSSGVQNGAICFIEINNNAKNLLATYEIKDNPQV